MSIIKALQLWLSDCPELQKLSKTGGHVDFTKCDKEDYGISPAGESAVRRYVDGSSVQQYSFSIFARRYTTEDVNRLANAEFMENLSQWMEEKSRHGELPQLGEWLEAQSIRCNYSALFEIDQSGKTGLYQVPCELIYRKKRRTI